MRLFKVHFRRAFDRDRAVVRRFREIVLNFGDRAVFFEALHAFELAFRRFKLRFRRFEGRFERRDVFGARARLHGREARLSLFDRAFRTGHRKFVIARIERGDYVALIEPSSYVAVKLDDSAGHAKREFRGLAPFNENGKSARFVEIPVRQRQQLNRARNHRGDRTVGRIDRGLFFIAGSKR